MRRFILALTALAAMLAVAAPSASTSHAQDAGQAPTIATFRGSYNGFSSPAYVGPVSLHAGLVIVRARHGGTANFAASILLPEGGKPAPETGKRYADYRWTTLLINAIGRYDGAAAALLPEDGDYWIELGAAGAYQFQIEQPTPDNVTPVDQLQFSGQEQQVTPVFHLDAGTHTLRATSDGTGNFHVWLYQVDDLGGAALNGDYAGRLIAVTSGPADESATVTLRRGGLYLIAVYASSLQTPTVTANWSVSVE